MEFSKLLNHSFGISDFVINNFVRFSIIFLKFSKKTPG